MGGVVLEVDGQTTAGCSKDDVVAMIMTAQRPLTLKIESPGTRSDANLVGQRADIAGGSEVAQQDHGSRVAMIEQGKPDVEQAGLDSARQAPPSTPGARDRSPFTADDALSGAPLQPKQRQAAWLEQHMAPEEMEAVRATFGPGPLGMGLAQIGDYVQVTNVEPDSQARAQGVELDSVIVQVAGRSVVGLNQAAVLDAIMIAERPVTLLFESRMSLEIKREDPVVAAGRDASVGRSTSLRRALDLRI